ncbi:MAG: TIM-barrel domain-containing protein [Chitinophagaceae bacterium]
MRQLKFLFPASIITLFVLLSHACFCQQPITYTKSGNSLTFDISKAKLSVSVVDTAIMQVKYTIADNFSTKKSLIIDDKKRPDVPFKVKQVANEVMISTSRLRAVVNLVTGVVAFYDNKGKLLLKEKNGKSRTVTPISIDGFKTNNISQQFQATAAEAIYGLGQHQDGLLDIKGYDLDFFQHNMEVYVPFFVSTNGYGLLWNNLSYTKFGHPDSIRVIPSAQMYNSNNVQGALSLKLYKDSAFKELLTGEKSSGDSISISKKDTLVYAAQFTGSLLADKTGEYCFYSYADGTFRCWVNDSLIIENWAPYANARDMGKINLVKGKKYEIVVEWSRYNRANSFNLKWRTPQYNKENIFLWSQAADEINYFVTAGNSIDEIISGYRTITGKATMLPKWALGFWQSRERYKSQEELLNTVKEFRTRKVPLDVIVQDWLYWPENKWGSQLFDSSRFPDPRGMLDTLHNELHTKMVISVWGKFYPNSNTFTELNNQGFLYQQLLKDSVRDFLKNHYTYYDAFNPGARKMYWKQITQHFFSKGVDGWWLDASEPELPDFGPTPELMARYMNPTYNGPGVFNLNAYPLMHTKGVYEGQRATDPSKRVCILTRSAFAGEQKNASIIWSGDISGEWGVLKASIPAGLGIAMSGMPYWTTDIGGFWVKYAGGNQNKAYRELFTRWYQFGALCPVFRVHGSSTPREIWFFGDEDDINYQTQLKFGQLRYRLMPYIYTLNGMVNHHDYTMMRALVMDFPTDKKTWDIKDQFMFGPSVLVNPVTSPGALSRQVYLPEGKGWYDFWTGHFFSGGQAIEAPAPADIMPLYLKAGAIIPFGPVLQYAAEKPADPIELRIYTGDNGSFNLYEDENENYGYEKGAYSNIPFYWNDKLQTLTIGDRKGNFPGMLQSRTLNIVFVDSAYGNGVSESKKFDKTIVYNGKQVIVRK